MTNLKEAPLPSSDHLSNAELREVIRQQVARDYERNLLALNRSAVLEYFPEFGFPGIRDANGEVYRLPGLVDIQRSIERDWELISTKWRQGFTQLQLTPMAMPLMVLGSRVEQQLLSHDQRQKLFSKGDEFDEPGSLRTVKLNRKRPIWWSDELFNGLREMEFIYFPRRFEQESHGGLSKEQLILQLQSGPFPGWSVCLIEDMVELPEEENVVTLENREQLPVDSCSAYYLEQLSSRPEYEAETGFTLEDFLTYFLLYLDATDQVSCDWERNGEICCIGNCFLDRRTHVPNGSWNDDASDFFDEISAVGYGSLTLNVQPSNVGTGGRGCRTAVRLK